MSRLRRWQALPGPERLVVVEAVTLLAFAPLAVRLLPVPRLLALMPAARSNPALAAERLACLVDAVAASVPWSPTCLHRALVTAAVMGRRNVPYELHLGVRRDATGFAAHAWIADRATTTNGYESLVHWRSTDIARR